MSRCVTCDAEFEPYRAAQKYCSRACWPSEKQRQTRLGADRVHASLPTSTTGCISELVVAADLLAKGYAVFRTLTPNSFCDLIAVRGEETRKIQVRTGRILNDKPYHCQLVRAGVTEVAVFYPDKDKIEYIPVPCGTD